MKKVNACEIGMKKLSWDKLFDSEQELVEIMLACPVDSGVVPTGYEYIKSFQKYHAKNGCLTEKQMTQVKRLAKSIYVSANGLNIGGYMVRLY